MASGILSEILSERLSINHATGAGMLNVLSAVTFIAEVIINDFIAVPTVAMGLNMS